MPAPTVSSLQDIVAGIQAAQAPENAQIDNSIAQNETSGNAQTAGLNAAKDNAFGTITQNAVNRGGYFSGFTPDAEAKYTGSTYLPALAKLQSTIASTRNTLLGQKATLATNANTAGLTEHGNQQKALDAYNQMLEQQANAAAEAERQRQFEAQQTAVNNAAAASRANAAASAKAAAAGPPPIQTGLTQLFSGYVPAKNGGTPFYTEQQIIPQIMNAYGLSQADAAKQVYAYRKQVFGE